MFSWYKGWFDKGLGYLCDAHIFCSGLFFGLVDCSFSVFCSMYVSRGFVVSHTRGCGTCYCIRISLMLAIYYPLNLLSGVLL